MPPSCASATTRSSTAAALPATSRTATSYGHLAGGHVEDGHAGGHVRWDLTRGSYDDLLRERGVPPLRA